MSITEEIKRTEHLTRQLDLIPLSCLGEPITVIGAGAIGSLVTLNLAKMGFSNLTVIDADKIEVENMNSQFYRRGDIGKPKVVALRELIQDFTGIEIAAINGWYVEGIFPGIVISAVDNMKVRKTVWYQHSMRAIRTKAVIDPRMGAETALLFAMDPVSEKDCETYEKSLYGDSEAVQERCTAKATMYTASMLAGLVAQVVKDVATGSNYCRSAMWSIKDYQFQGWRKELKA